MGAEQVVYLSSLSVYGTIRVSVVDETTPIRDPDVYGKTKYRAEGMLSDRVAAGKGRLSGLAIRLPGVVGPGAHRNWLATTLAKIRAGQSISVFNPDAPFNNVVHVADLATFIARILERGWRGYDLLTIAARDPLPIRGVVERLISLSGSKAELRQVPARQRAFTVTSARAVNRYGYSPASVAEILIRFASEQ